MMIRWWEHGEKGVTDGQTDRRTDGLNQSYSCLVAAKNRPRSMILFKYRHEINCDIETQTSGSFLKVWEKMVFWMTQCFQVGINKLCVISSVVSIQTFKKLHTLKFPFVLILKFFISLQCDIISAHKFQGNLFIWKKIHYQNYIKITIISILNQYCWFHSEHRILKCFSWNKHYQLP